MATRTIARLLLYVRVSRSDRLQSVRSDSGVEFRNARRLSDKALVSLLGEFALNLNRRLNAARAKKLLEHGRSGGESLLDVIYRERKKIHQHYFATRIKSTW